MRFYTDAELEALLADAESDLVERKETFAGTTPKTLRQAICAFANDLPGHRRPGVVFVGARDDAVLRANAQEEPRFDVDAQWVRCLVRARPDWPGNLPPNRQPPRGL